MIIDLNKVFKRKIFSIRGKEYRIKKIRCILPQEVSHNLLWWLRTAWTVQEHTQNDVGVWYWRKIYFRDTYDEAVKVLDEIRDGIA